VKTLRIGSSLTALGLLAGLAACGGDGQGPNTRPLSQDEQGLVHAANDFGFRLLEEVAAEQGQDNLFISPLSVSLALGMTYNGARGETEQAMRQTLGLGELSREQINDGYRGLIDLLCELDPKVTVEIANSIWYRDGFDVLQAFVEVNVEHFDAVVRALDFADAGAADTINAWVSEKTHGKIDEIVEPPINAATVMFLINAVYFKGDWMLQFDPEDTREQAFHGPGGARQVPMMNMHTELAYLETDRAQIVDLPYGHGLYSMTVVLPKPEVDRAELIAGLDRNRWQQWMNGLVE
jgi:serine protease inhibitor